MIKIKKPKSTQERVIKRRPKFKDYENCLEANQHEKELKYLEKNKLVEDILTKNHKEFIKSNRLILKSKQRYKSEKHNVFTIGVNKIVLSANNDIDSIETFA